ncbi:MAG TPA: FtsX-like permease family protein, partial [bacterium]|nr:FtsX-like permease family protein [bacterium]
MFLTLTIILLVGLAGYLLFVATRQRLFLSIALRNIRRRKATSLLVVLGAMVGTAMISSSLAVGDTLDYSIKQEVYKRLGALDSFVVTEAASENASLYAAETLEQVFFSAEVGEYVREQTGETVDGVLAALIAYVSAAKIEEPGGEPVLAQPVVTLLGADLEAYQEFFTTQPLPDMTTEDIIISEKLADRLEAGPGDWLRFSLWGQTKEFQVKMVLPDDQVPGINFEGYTALLSLDSVHGLLTLFGKLDTLIPPAFLATVPDEAKEYFFTELEKTRSLLQQLPPHPVNMLMISSAGSVAGGAETSEASIAAVKTALDRYNTENQVELRFRVRELKKDAVAIAEQAGAGFTALFIILGGFTIAAGILLIVNIFIMLAEERKREIGILRAMGMKRRTLTSLFAVEGLLYTLVASSLGALGGIAATWLVIAGVQQVLRTFSLVSSFEIQFTFELTSLLIAFGAGVAITFAAIIFASVKLSRMQIVHALRELLRSQTTRFSPRALILPVLGFLLGLLLCGIGFTRSWPELELLGPSLLVVCIAFGLRHWVNERLLFSLASAAVLAYTILAPVYLDRYFQGEFIFILTGLFLVVATVILLVFNEVLLIA